MAGRKVARYVTALDDTGRMVTFEPGTEVSEKVAEGIDNPKAWEADAPPEEPVAPAKSRRTK